MPSKADKPGRKRIMQGFVYTAKRDDGMAFAAAAGRPRCDAALIGGPDLLPSRHGVAGSSIHRIDHVVDAGSGGVVRRRCVALIGADRSPHWVKVKNRQHPAFARVLDQFS
jgi:hypothetical protein